ncbi:MAG: hypothetical protein ACE5IC_10495, partial [Candidatus Brocadiales bacterium]
EEGKERHNWGKLETMPYVRNTAAKDGMTTEERTEMEEELKALLGEPAEEEGPKAAELPSTKEKGFVGGLFTRMGASRGILQTYNPDISVIGDFTGTFIHPGDGRGPYSFEKRNFEGREFADRLALREIELGFMAALDPYTRGDFFIGIHEGEIEVEEGYMTLLTLPHGLQAKIGQFKPAIGKVSRTHRPEIFQVDYPLIIRNLFGEEAIRDPGLSVSWLVPNPWDKYIELTGEVMTTRGLNEPYYVMHLKNFFDLTLNSSLEVGLTGFTGDLKTDFEEGTSDVRANMVGLDLTYRWKPVTFKARPYKSFLWQAEAFFTQVDDIDDAEKANDKEDSWGAYTFGEYQLTRRNYAGLRLDYAQSLVNNKDFEWAVSPYWTFWQSDFVRWRLQYTHTQRRIDSIRGPSSDDAIMLQSTWSMGIHRPHPF